MVDVMDVQCPACGHRTRVLPDSVGRQARCQCGFTFPVSDAVLTEVDPEAAASGDVSPPQTTYRPGGGLPGVGPVPRSAGPPVGEAPELPLEIERLLPGDETILFAEKPPVSVGRVRGVLKLVAVGGPLSLWVLVMTVSGQGGAVCVGIAAMGGVGVVLLLKYLGWRNRFYVVTNRATVVRSGFVKRSVTLVPHHCVVTISVETGFADRWCHTQTVRLMTVSPGWTRRGVLLDGSAHSDRVVSLLGSLIARQDVLL